MWLRGGGSEKRGEAVGISCLESTAIAVDVGGCILHLHAQAVTRASTSARPLLQGASARWMPLSLSHTHSHTHTHTHSVSLSLSLSLSCSFSDSLSKKRARTLGALHPTDEKTTPSLDALSLFLSLSLSLSHTHTGSCNPGITTLLRLQPLLEPTAHRLPR